MDESEFDRFADEYRELHARGLLMSGEGPEFFWRYKVVDVAGLAQFAGIRPSRILDFGAGVGNAVPYFRDCFPGASLTCLDVSRKSLAIGQHRFDGDAEFVWFDGGAVPFENGTFDIAFAACVLHHIAPTEQVRLLGELGRVVRPGGMVAVFEHNPLNPLTRKVVRECPFDVGVTLIGPHELQRRFIAAGLPSPKIRYRLFFPHLLAALRPLEALLGWLPLGAQYCAVALV
jgi:ubiquinone/menaquinone biosynthesis C-methylase UbiE